MALRRSPFIEKLGVCETQLEKLREAVNETLAKESLPLHREAFSDKPGDGPDELPRLRNKARQVSKALDQTIADLLTDDQKRELVPLLKVERELVRLPVVPGIGS